jgi:hypothetical protein
MKISRPASPQPSGTAGKLTGVAPKKAKDFAAKLDKASAKRAVSTGRPKPADVASSKAASHIGADLKAGRITPQTAIDKVIDRIVAQQLGIHAAPAAKEKIGAALRERLADDPLLAAKVRALSDD